MNSTGVIHPLLAVSAAGRIQIVSIVAAAALLVIVFEMVRSRSLMERYALTWLLSGVVLLLLAVFDGLLARLSVAIGIATPANALFLVAFGFVTLVLLHFSATISRLTDQTKVLAQKLASTEEQLRRMQRQSKVPGVDQHDTPSG